MARRNGVADFCKSICDQINSFQAPTLYPLKIGACTYSKHVELPVISSLWKENGADHRETATNGCWSNLSDFRVLLSSLVALLTSSRRRPLEGWSPDFKLRQEELKSAKTPHGMSLAIMGI